MNLLVDIGNSRLKWAQHSMNGLANHGSVSRDNAELQALLDEHWSDITAPEQILVSNVAGPAVVNEFTEWTLAKWGCPPCFASVSRSSCGVTNVYRDHTQLGVDRWLAAIAAWHKYRGPVCIVDCGTALTVDAVDEGGRHLGGLIMPGLVLMQESLARRAPGIRPTTRPAVFSGFADNTMDAVRSGCVTAIVAAIERCATMLHEQLGSDLTCLITGGDADYLLSHISSVVPHSGFRHEPHIVLEGLATVFRGDTA